MISLYFMQELFVEANHALKENGSNSLKNFYQPFLCEISSLDTKKIKTQQTRVIWH